MLPSTRHSLQWKLTFLMTLAGGVTLLVATVAFIINDVSITRRSKQRQMTALADVLATNGAAAISFQFPASATDLLASLKNRPTIESACFFDEGGQLFATYRRDAQSSLPAKLPDWEGHRFQSHGYLDIVLPVVEGDRRIGAIYMRASMDDVKQQLYSNALIILGVVVLSLVVAVVFSIRFQRAISVPILDLASAAERITKQGDYSIRVRPRSDDEIGRLYEQFNSMLEQIHVSRVERETLIAQLESQNAELERFTYTVSHDLKTPLITIRWLLGALREDITKSDTEQVAIDMEGIVTASDHMFELLSDLLELSRIGRIVNPPEDVSLNELAAEVLYLSSSAIEKNSISVKVAPNLPVVRADRKRLHEVLQNLVENAIKYLGDQPDPHIEIGVRHDDEPPVCFIRDNGIGIDPAYHERVFGLFEQLNKDADGSGVGLALVKRIVETHGGRIWVESKGLGHGVTVCFTIPSDTDESASVQPEATPGELEGNWSPTASSRPTNDPIETHDC